MGIPRECERTDRKKRGSSWVMGVRPSPPPSSRLIFSGRCRRRCINTPSPPPFTLLLSTKIFHFFTLKRLWSAVHGDVLPSPSLLKEFLRYYLWLCLLLSTKKKPSVRRHETKMPLRSPCDFSSARPVGKPETGDGKHFHERRGIQILQ